MTKIKVHIKYLAGSEINFLGIFKGATAANYASITGHITTSDLQQLTSTNQTGQFLKVEDVCWQENNKTVKPNETEHYKDYSDIWYMPIVNIIEIIPAEGEI